MEWLSERLVETVIYVWLGTGYMALGVFWAVKAVPARALRPLVKCRQFPNPAVWPF